MKRLNLVGAVLVLSLLVPSLAFASTTDKTPSGDTIPSECHIPPDHAVYSTDGLDTLLGCITKADWDLAMANQNTVGAVNLPTFAPGTSITDQHGVTFECSAWVMGFTNCVNMTGTKWYTDDMNMIAQALIAQDGGKGSAAAQWPILAGWIEAQ
jgi:hypothetical protein